jgi:hypothetical protein
MKLKVAEEYGKKCLPFAKEIGLKTREKSKKEKEK